MERVIMAEEKTTWPELVMSLYERLAERGAGVSLEFKDLTVEMPQDVSGAPRTIRINGSFRVNTEERGG